MIVVNKTLVYYNIFRCPEHMALSQRFVAASAVEKPRSGEIEKIAK